MTKTVPGLLACALALASLAGCSGDDDTSGITTTTIDEAAFAREQMCESLKAYTDEEDQGTPRPPSTNLDQAGPTTTGAPRSDPRLTALERLEASLTPDVPEEARAALAEMKEIRSQPLDDSNPTAVDANINDILPALFDHLDPICDSVKGRDPSAPTTTTIARASTTTTPAGGATTTTVAATTTSAA